jgi:hypothetical protein
VGKHKRPEPSGGPPADVADVLRRLREHFHEWPGYEGHEHDLVGFAYYEGCGDRPCCGDILAEAAPVALGAELVARHGFAWASLGPGRLAVTHPALAGPVDLAALEGGAWCDEPPGTPSRGEVTHGSLAGLVRAVGGRLSGK